MRRVEKTCGIPPAESYEAMAYGMYQNRP